MLLVTAVVFGIADYARKKGITAISLEATDMGRVLYEKYGFIKMNNEMELEWNLVNYKNSTGNFE